MCGIVAYINKNGGARNFVKEKLNLVSYRGYDAHGYISMDMNGNLGYSYKVLKDGTPKIDIVEGFKDCICIGHCRWSSVGDNSIVNTHPIASYDNTVHIVHNGNIDNSIQLKNDYKFKYRGQTDTEIIANYLARFLKYGNDIDSIKQVLQTMPNTFKGSYSFLFISSYFPGKIIGFNNGCPLLYNTNIIASDGSIFEDSYYKSQVGEVIILHGEHIDITHKKPIVYTNTKDNHDLGQNPHYMLKEINEQLEYVKNYQFKSNLTTLSPFLYLIGCGTSYHAAMIGERYFSDISHINAKAEYAANIDKEWGNRLEAINDGNIDFMNSVLSSFEFIFISQSGETKDTIDAVLNLKDYNRLCIVNRDNSTLTDFCSRVFNISAGLEVAVASTKTFTGSVLKLLEMAYSNTEEPITKSINLSLQKQFLYRAMTKVDISEIEKLAQDLKDYKHLLCLGRGYNYVVALEAALKFKEVAYIHAEGIHASEIKHGPLALIDDDTASLFITAGYDDEFEKILNNIQEIKARNGKIWVIASHSQYNTIRAILPEENIIAIDGINEYLQPILNTYVVQLMSYFVGKLKDLPIDCPRSLCKSVTVD